MLVDAQRRELARRGRLRVRPQVAVERGVAQAVDRRAVAGAAGVEAHEVEVVEQRLAEGLRAQRGVRRARLARATGVDHERAEAGPLVGGRDLEEGEPDRGAGRVAVVERDGQRGALVTVVAVGPLEVLAVERRQRRPTAVRWAKVRPRAPPGSVRRRHRRRSATRRRPPRGPSRPPARSRGPARSRRGAASPGGCLQRHHHRLEGERDGHVELEHLLAGLEDPADPAQVELGGRGAHDLLDVAAQLLVDQLATARRERDGVAVDGGEVHQAAVDHVEVAPLGPRLLGLLHRGQGRCVLARPAAALHHAVGRVEVGALAGVEVAGDHVGLLLRGLVRGWSRRSCRTRDWSAAPARRSPRGGGCAHPRRVRAHEPGRCGPGWRARSTTRARRRRRRCGPGSRRPRRWTVWSG